MCNSYGLTKANRRPAAGVACRMTAEATCRRLARKPDVETGACPMTLLRDNY